MKDYIAFCGLDCERCEARLATVNDDDALRERVAKLWSELNGVEITVKTPFCDSLCEIRHCALAKHMETCGSCGEMDRCEKLAMIIGNNAEARGNLKS